ncbi:MAG: HAD family hydrolase [Candidatus Kariarchaeaceae archaeon]|jgi:phosphoserine phosphatase
MKSNCTYRLIHNIISVTGFVKAVFLDVDGTLTNGLSAWERVHHHFGVVDQMNEHTDLFYSGKISYDEWANIDVGLWKGRSYSELQQALEEVDLLNGAKEGIQMLKNAGFDTVLVSGGIDVFAQNVADLVGADHVVSNTIGHNNGIIDGTVQIKVSFSKANVIEDIMIEQGYDLNKSGAIGDNTNDIAMFKKVKYSIALNSKHPSVDEVADISLRTDNFQVVAQKFLSLAK